MNWDHIAERWSEYQPNARRRWSLLTRDDFDAIASDRERLVAKIGERYGTALEEAEAQLVAWLEALREVSPFR